MLAILGVREELDHRASEVVVVCWMVVVVCYWEGAEGAEVKGRVPLQLVYGIEGVTEEGFAAGCSGA